MIPSDCFDLAMYQRMLAGQLPADEADRMLDHLEQCERCLNAVRKLPEDAIVASMRARRKGSADRLRPAFVAGLVEAILKHSGQDSSARLDFACPTCHRTIQAGKESAGQNMKCPLCGQVVCVPAAPSV